MNLLLIAPDRTGVEINQIREIRDITRLHNTLVLNGPVTQLDIEHAISSSNHDFQIIHFATHLNSSSTQSLDEILLSDGETLGLRDVARLARMAGARLVFFNICLAARFGSYLVRNGVPAVIYTTVDIVDEDAWRLPRSFYERIARVERRGGVVDFKAAFDKVDSGDGVYGWSANGVYYSSLLAPIEEVIKGMQSQLHDLSLIVEKNSQAIGTNGIQHQKDRMQIYTTYFLVAATVLILFLLIWGERFGV